MKERTKELISTWLANDCEYDCVCDMVFTDYFKCPFEELDELGYCIGTCNHKEYFKQLIDHLEEEKN